LIVLNLEEGAAAANAGVMIGDIVVAIDGKATREPNDVQAALRPDMVGTTINVAIVRGGEKRELRVTGAERSKGAR
jgi:S1-C subfamily serine protease